jgi:hypothetical protein
MLQSSQESLSVVGILEGIGRSCVAVVIQHSCKDPGEFVPVGLGLPRKLDFPASNELGYESGDIGVWRVGNDANVR